MYFVFSGFYRKYDIVSQNRIIDSVFNYDGTSYDGYIYIPRFNVRRLIKKGTDSSILDDLYVGIHDLSCDIMSDCLVILAGHNVKSVFSSLHDISIDDEVFICSFVTRRFVVYDKKIVSENDFSYFYDRPNELLLITCTDNDGYRLLVFLREVL